MPIFGHKNRNNAASNTGYNSNAGYDATAGYNNAPGGTGAGGNRLHRDQGMHNDPTHPSPNAPGATGFNNPPGNIPHSSINENDQQGYGGGSTTAGTTSSAANHAMVPQTDAFGNPVHPRSGGAGSRLAGKVESAVGTIFGSENLKHKGMQKEQESQALKVQAAELSEAERLEQAALARRQRAVAHGAHPDHRHLGSHNPGAGATNLNELGGGTNSGIGGIGGAGSNARGGY